MNRNTNNELSTVQIPHEKVQKRMRYAKFKNEEPEKNNNFELSECNSKHESTSFWPVILGQKQHLSWQEWWRKSVPISPTRKTRKRKKMPPTNAVIRLELLQPKWHVKQKVPTEELLQPKWHVKQKVFGYVDRHPNPDSGLDEPTIYSFCFHSQSSSLFLVNSQIIIAESSQFHLNDRITFSVRIAFIQFHPSIIVFFLIST